MDIPLYPSDWSLSIIFFSFPRISLRSRWERSGLVLFVTPSDFSFSSRSVITSLRASRIAMTSSGSVTCSHCTSVSWVYSSTSASSSVITSTFESPRFSQTVSISSVSPPGEADIPVTSGSAASAW